ncbi:MAG: hypothetical protein HFJ28_04940 [Clostridia bacterium]|nr:hypothetical protein [Clostridia bacterium]
MSKKIYLAYTAYLVFVVLSFSVVILILTACFKVQVQLPGYVEAIFFEERPEIPKQKDFQKVEKAYTQVYTCLVDQSELKEQIQILYDQTMSAVICSDTNFYFNQLDELYKEYSNNLAVLEEQIELYEQEYYTYKKLLANIPAPLRSYREKMYTQFYEEIEPKYQEVCNLKETYLAELKHLEQLHKTAKELAESLYEESHDIMSRLMTREAGNCSVEEICIVARIVENRVYSPKFPNTLLEVIYQKNQYSPAITGSINLPPYERVVEIMDEYLHGRIRVDVPRNVLYQALFIPSGSKGEWRHMPSGHYFCYG